MSKQPLWWCGTCTEMLSEPVMQHMALQGISEMRWCAYPPDPSLIQMFLYRKPGNHENTWLRYAQSWKVRLLLN